eukprot:14987998-Alexandrium_andersonii.AAC.1
MVVHACSVQALFEGGLALVPHGESDARYKDILAGKFDVDTHAGHLDALPLEQDLLPLDDADDAGNAPPRLVNPADDAGVDAECAEDWFEIELGRLMAEEVSLLRGSTRTQRQLQQK